MVGSLGDECHRGSGKVGAATSLAVALTLAGCVTPPATLPADHPLIQANEYMAELATARRIAQKQEIARSSKPLDRLDDKLFGDAPVKPVQPVAPRPKVTEGPGYRQFTETYAYTEPSVQLNHWNEAFRRACGRHGGTLVSDTFCSAKNDPDRVLFIVNIRPGRGSTSVWFDITLVEPTVQPASAEYTRQLLAAGFVTQAVREGRARAAEAATAGRVEAERARLAIDWPRMQVRGQMVCKEDGQIRYVGYVEDFTNERMKVSVTQATVGSTGWSPTSFKPGVVWTTPEGWAPCEWIRR